MNKFRFTINKSFISTSTHPITIPKSQVDYTKLENCGLGYGSYIIIFPKGEKYKGYMYFGTAGYGPYFQLRFETGQPLPKYLELGDKVIILLYKDGNQRYAVIEMRE